MKIAINACHGGFSLTPEVKLACYRRGMTSIASPVGEYFADQEDLEKYLKQWRDYKKNPKEGGFFLNVFSDEEDVVLHDPGIEFRNDPILIQVLEEFGDRAGTKVCKIQIVEVDDDYPWMITEYDGWESVVFDGSQFEAMYHLGKTDPVMRELFEQCQIYYNLKRENKTD